MHQALPDRAVSPARRSGSLLLAALLGTTFITGAATPVAWATTDDDMVDVTGLARIEDPALEDLRGGFSLGPWQVSFGVMIKTTIKTATDQISVLQTSFNVYTPGQISELKQQFLQAAPVAAEAAQNAAQNAAQQAVQAVQNAAQQAAEAAQQAAQSAQGAAQQAVQQAAEAAEQAAQQAAAAQGSAESAQAAVEQSLSNAGDTLGTTNQGATSQGTPLPEPQSFPTMQAALDSLGGGGDPDAALTGSSLPADQSETDEGAGAPQNPFTLTEFEGGLAISNGVGTDIVQQVTGGVVTQIVNQMNGVDISHATELNLFVQNFSAVVNQAAVRSATDNLALQSIINNPLLGQ